eukprot:16450025-Heterocapsa_arctica.AAC.1
MGMGQSRAEDINPHERSQQAAVAPWRVAGPPLHERPDEDELVHYLNFRGALKLGKMIAGFVRLVAEDILNGSCQMIYLCKIWRDPDVSSA